MADKLLPQSIEAECGVLGSIIIDPEAIVQVSDFLFPEDFYRDAHRTIYEFIVQLYEQREPADFITLCDKLSRNNKLEGVGGASYITSLINQVPTSGNVEYYGRIVAAKSLHRRLIHAAGQIAAHAYEEDDAALEFAEASIYSIAHLKSNERTLVRVGTVFESQFGDLLTPHESKGAIVGVPSGFQTLDSLTSGFQRSDFILLAGRPAMGKTALALTIARNAATYGRNTAFFSIEMSKEALTQRLTALEARIDLHRYMTKDLSDEESERAIAVSSTIFDLPLWIDDTPGLTINQLRSKIRRAMTEHEIDMVVIDYLQKIKATNENGKRIADRVQEVSEVARELKNMAREFNIPIFSLAQLSRAVESRASKVPQLSDLRDSGEIEQETDIVFFIYRDDYYAGFNSDGSSRSERPGTADIICAKHRNGPVGEIALGFQANQTRFYDLEIAPELPRYSQLPVEVENDELDD